VLVFSRALVVMDRHYDSYKANVASFKQMLVWTNIAETHKALYKTMVEKGIGNLVLNG
jgi:hypothetical protein